MANTNTSAYPYVSRLHMAPDVYQNFMLTLFRDKEFVDNHLDDLLILTNRSFKYHILNLEMV
jgi:hypothetical protein